MVGAYYNMYDNGTLILESAQAKEITSFLNNENLNVASYANMNNVYKGRYTFEKVGEPLTLDDRFIKEWNEAVAPFRRIQWVKSGGRKLGGR